MLRSLFSFCRLRVLWAGVWLLLTSVSSVTASPHWQRLALQEAAVNITLNNISPASPNVIDSIITIDLDITFTDTFDITAIEGFSFALAYDADALTLWNVLDNGLQTECGWFFGFVNYSDQDPAEAPNSVLWIVGENISGASAKGLGCLEPGEPLVTLQFETRDDTLFNGTFTTLDFYWRDCHDNIIWTKDHDTIPLALVALEVFNADGMDIADMSKPLPSFAGPDATCLNPFGDTMIVPAVRFQSGKIEFKVPTDVMETPLDGQNLPSAASLRQNYPNPFNPTTTIEFYLPVRTEWRLEIINLNGQIITEFSGVNGPGSETLDWDSRDNKNRPVSSGVYFYRLVTEKHSSSRKMLLLK